MARICQKKKGCKHSITVDYKVEDIYNYYKRNGGELSNKEFRAVVRLINKQIADDIATGKKVVLPQNLGSMTLRKYRTSIKVVDGKVKTNRKINWGETHKLWMEDKEAFDNHILVRENTERHFLLHWRKPLYKSKNMLLYSFRPARSLRSLINENLNNGKLIDALPIRQ